MDPALVRFMNRLDVVLFALAGFFLLIACGLTYNTYRFVRSAAQTQGIVLHAYPGSRNEDVQIGYRVPGGRYYTPWVKGVPSEFSAGERVRVLYDPKNPSNGTLNIWYVWAGGNAICAFLAFFSIFLWVMSGGLRRVAKRRRARFNEEAQIIQ